MKIIYKDRSYEEDDKRPATAEHLRENIELSAIYFEPVCTLSAVTSRPVTHQMK